RVKVNEANVAIIQINNGIEILKMALCELCGLPMTADFRLADEGVDDPQFADAYTLGDYDMAWQNRPELRALNVATRIGDEQVRLARSEFLPTVALTGGYFASYPSVFNSFEKKFKGTWFVGVAVNVPILTWGERSFKVRAAQAQAASAQIRYEETCEAVELQVHQCRQRLTEAQERLTVSLSSQEEANENLRIANLGMRQGVIPVSNVIEAQTAWLGARSNLISAYIDVHLAHIYLQKSLGIIQQ
ncbi:MAG: TolC family protein, partial [Muribaculaceae bacterium]